jgi:tetraacyldisaccharide 4'-kinase
VKNGPEARLVAAWYDGATPPLWARLLEPIYRAAAGLRRAAYRRGWKSSGHPGVPVIVIGNLTAGGTGKTPLAIWLLLALAERGRKPALVSRGYGGAEPEEPHRVGPGDAAAVAGDEPLLVARQSGAPVWVCRDRLAAARAAAAAGADVIVADDGLQHYRLRRDFEIVVVDAQRGFGNGRLLPAGPLREPVARLLAADAVVCNGPGPHCPAGAIAMTLGGSDAVRLDGSERRPLAGFRDGQVHAVAGIGNPERFFRFLEAQGLEVVRHALPDHAPVPADLLAPPDGRPVLMTSKDAMRCHGRPGVGAAWEVPVTAELEAGGRALLERLATRLGMSEA